MPSKRFPIVDSLNCSMNFGCRFLRLWTPAAAVTVPAAAVIAAAPAAPAAIIAAVGLRINSACCTNGACTRETVLEA